MAYDRDQFVGGSSVLSLTLFEVGLWNWYSVYIKRNKIDRIETPLSLAGAGTGSFKNIKKVTDAMAMPAKIKKSALEMFHRHKKFKPKKRVK